MGNSKVNGSHGNCEKAIQTFMTQGDSVKTSMAAIEKLPQKIT